MAMIVEVLTRSGEVRTRVRLDRLPLTVGRACDNDLILDDAYADARHARIGVDDAGDIVVEDLGSVNRLLATATDERVTRVPVRPGTEVRLGRTTLRFRGPGESLPPALPDGGGVRRARRWAANPWSRLLIASGALATLGFTSWLGSYARSSASDAFALVLGLGMLAALWAGIWAIAGRIVVHRFHFLGHFALICALMVVLAVYAELASWGEFLFPDHTLHTVLGVVFALACLAGLVAAHLALASSLDRRRRWRTGLITSLVLFALIGSAVLVDDESFSDVPEFSSVLKPAPPRLVPTLSAGDFDIVVHDLRDQVDALAAQMNARTAEW